MEACKALEVSLITTTFLNRHQTFTEVSTADTREKTGKKKERTDLGSVSHMDRNGLKRQPTATGSNKRVQKLFPVLFPFVHPSTTSCTDACASATDETS